MIFFRNILSQLLYCIDKDQNFKEYNYVLVYNE